MNKVIGWFRAIIIDKFFLSYLKDLIKRLDGYKTLLGIVFLGLQVAKIIVPNPEAKGIIDVILSAFGDTFNQVASPDEIGVFAASLIAIWGTVHKIYKWFKGVPQVPTIVQEKTK